MPAVPFSRRFLRDLACAFALPLAFAAAGAHAADADHAPSPQGLVRTLLASFDPVRTTSGFAARRHPVKKRVHFHHGVDFAAPHGTPVRSVADGRVTFAGWQKGYGKVVYIEHKPGEHTVYAHLSRIDVRSGDTVAVGRTIGAVGNTGVATGPHLHFEVREHGKPVDPMKWALPSLRDAVPPAMHAVVETPDTTRCVALLQKFSLESLSADELDLLRRGCAQ